MSLQVNSNELDFDEVIKIARNRFGYLKKKGWFHSYGMGTVESIEADVIQDVCEAILKRIASDTLKTIRTFPPFVSAIAYYKTVNVIIDGDRYFLFDTLLIDSYNDFVIINDYDGFVNQQTVNYLLSYLPPKTRKIVNAYREGFTHKEIGKMFGCSANSSRVTISNAKKSLREIFERIDPHH